MEVRKAELTRNSARPRVQSLQSARRDHVLLQPVEVLGLFFLHIVEKRELPCLWIVPTRRGAELHAIICREGYAEGVVAALGRRQDTEFGVTCSRWVLAFSMW